MPNSDNADVEDADFEGADLTDAKNLDKAEHVQDADFVETQCPDGTDSDDTGKPELLPGQSHTLKPGGGI